MKNILQRTLSALLCLVMITSITPAWSEATPSATLEIIQETATPVPTEAPTPEAENTILPKITAEPEISAEPEAPAEPEITVQPETTAEPEASASPEITTEPENTPEPEITAEPVQDENQVLTMEQALTQLSGEETPAPDAQENGFAYTIADGQAAVTGYTGSEEILTVPDMLGGCPVTAIADEAFLGNTAIAEILLPETLQHIGAYAFSGCTALQRVTLSEAELTIGDYAFSGCTALESLILPYMVQIGENAFENCAALVLEIYAGSAADAYTTENAIACVYREAIQPTNIIPEKAKITIGLKETVSLAGYTLEPAGAQSNVTYYNKTNKVVQVHEDGTVTGKKAGSYTDVYLTTENGIQCSVKVTVKKAPSSISISADRNTIGVGEQLKITPKLTKNTASYHINYISSDETIATVDASGMLTAHKSGTVSITAATFNGKTTKTPLEITVLEAPEAITLTDSERILGNGDGFTLGYTLNENSAGTVLFTSSDETVATVDAKGKVKVVSDSGSAVITAAVHNGISAQCSVTAMPAPTAISITAERKTIGKGEQLQLSTALSPEDSVATLKFKSSKSSVAGVDANGLVTAKKTGSATITVTAHNGIKKTIKITVKKAPSSVKLAADRTVLGVGEEMQLSYKLSSKSAGKVTYTSSDETIARISESGVLSCIAPGTVTITAATFNGKTGSMDFTVCPAPESITLNAEAITLARSDSYTLKPTLSEGSAGAITYESSDTSIATVSASGKITAHKKNKGEAVITATAYNDLTAQCMVTVTHGPSSIAISAERKTIGVGEKLQLTTSLAPEGSAATIKFKSGKSSVASVDANGLVTGKKAGKATITATTHNGKKKSIKITVKKAPSSVTLVAPQAALSVGDTLQLTYKLSSGSVGTVTYTALTPEIASITPEGVVTAVAPGAAQFAAIAHNGVSSEPCTLEILPAPTEILVDTPSIMLGEGLTATLTARVNEGSVGAITYSSENPEIAAVDPNSGKITAVAPGTTRICAATYVDGLFGYAEVQVKAAPGSVSLPMSSVTLGAGDTLQLNPQVDADALTSLSYSSKSTKIAKVSADGLITAVADGETTITVKTHNGKSCKLTVKVKAAPKSITALQPKLTLGVGETHVIGYKLTSDTMASVRFESLNADIASVDAAGHVVAHAVGNAEILLTTHNGKSCTVAVNVVPAPEEVVLSAARTLAVGMQDTAAVTLLPENSASTVYYSANLQQDDAGAGMPVVQIDENGVITALNPGKAVIRAATYAEDVYAEHIITVLPAPTFVSFTQQEYSLNTDDTLQLLPMVDAGTMTTFTYTAKKNDFFTIDANGLVTPVMRGTTTVTVTTHNGLTATATITVFDPYYPEDMMLAVDPPAYMESNDTFLPVVTTVPETAVPAIVWSSSDTEIVEVDETTGEVTAVSYGQATITGVSSRNPSLKISFKITVLDTKLCLTMPATRTTTSKINTTLTQIRAVRSSAYKELDRLYAQGVITKSDRDARKGCIERAFDMHLFPWMTDTKELYWNANNSEDGAKDYKPGIVYYGLPYTQTNRNFNVDKAVSKGYYTKTSKGYYKMQGDKFDSRLYPGNDCSSFVSMAYYGTDSKYSFLNTRSLASTNIYRTLTDWEDLRPGDLLNKGGSHVVMFLYYANEAKTQMVIIEQGGSASADRGVDNLAYSNTVACSIKNVEYYTSRNYKIRRHTSLGY